MRNRIVTAVKQRFSIRKLSIGAASVLLGTSLYFMGVSAPVVHAATNGETPASSETSTDSKDPVSVAGQSKYSDVDVNNAIDQYAEKNQDAVNEQEEKEKTGNKVIIRPSDKQPVTVYNTTDRKTQVENIIQKEINDGITKANQNWDKIQEYKKNHNDQQILNGTESDYFENQGLSIDDEKGSEINKITVTDDKDTTKTKDVDTKAVDGETKDIGEITKIADFDGIDITHTSNMTDKEREAMKVNSDNKVIVDFQPAQYQDQDKEIDKEITVTYDNLNNSYYLENINDETNRIKISRIDRTFSSIKVADNPHRFYGGWRGNKYDNYDPCNGPQLIIYNDPSDGFFYNNIEQISVKDIYYDDKGNPIKTGDNKTGDKNTAWIFVTSLNSNGGGNIEKVRAVGPDNSPVNAEKIAGSTVIDHNDGWWYSGSNNNFGTDPDWDNNDENNLFGFVGTVAFQYYPGMTLQYRADDSQWGSHWASMQTQVVSSLYTPVIIYDHIKDGYSRSDDVNMTVHYVMDDGSEAQSDSKQTVSVTESGIKDSVTGKITWTPADSQTFKDVVTPKMTGYKPDQDKVAGQTVKFGDNDIEVTVTYSPDKQFGHIDYIDDGTKTTLTTDNFSGKTNGHENYTPTNRIQEFENKGYEFVSSDYPDGGFNFDDNDQQEQVFHVHLKHGTVTVTTKNPQTPNTSINPNDPQSPKYPKDINNTNKDVKRTIDYKFKDGKTAQPTVNDSLHFERTVVIDKVTGKVSSDTWTPSQDFNDIQTPAVQGYTPDKAVVSDKNIDHNHDDIIEHVVYSPDKQHMTITYIDDTTGKTLHTDNPEGVSDQDAKYTTKHTIEQFEDQHYKLISDSTNGKDLIFDHDDNVNQTYEVHFVHGTQDVNRQDDVTETVDYKFENGETAQPTVTQTKHFSEDGVKDLVTGNITWTPADSQTFKDVVTPKMTGYKPDQDKVAGQTVKFGDKDVEVTVRYTANAQTATITYIDDTEKKTLGSDKQNGKFNQVITFEHDPAEVIKGLEEKGYKLVSDNFKPGIKYQNDNKSNNFEVHLVHTYEPVETSQTITETVHYIDANGNPVAPDHVAKVVIEVTGTRDKVTDSITWNTPSTGHFDEVISPEVPNMTPDKKLIPGRDVQYGDNDITENVVYTSDNPTSKTPKKPHKKPHKPNNSISKTPKKSHKLGNPTSKTPKKPHKSGNPTSKTPENKQSGTIVKTAIPEKPIDSRTVDNHASAKSAGKRELPQTGATTNIGIWTGLVSMIASLGLLGASKKRKKN